MKWNWIFNPPKNQDACCSVPKRQTTHETHLLGFWAWLNLLQLKIPQRSHVVFVVQLFVCVHVCFDWLCNWINTNCLGTASAECGENYSVEPRGPVSGKPDAPWYTRSQIHGTIFMLNTECILLLQRELRCCSRCGYETRTSPTKSLIHLSQHQSWAWKLKLT